MLQRNKTAILRALFFFCGVAKIHIEDIAEEQSHYKSCTEGHIGMHDRTVIQ